MSLHPHVPSSTQVRSPNGTTSADKLLFFDRAKKSLENREVYEEFLKLLSLFSKEIIDLKTLVERTKVFLGDGELMTEFKGLVGWDDKVENVEGGPPGSIRTGPPEALLALPVDDGEGPSYRRLPDSVRSTRLLESEIVLLKTCPGDSACVLWPRSALPFCSQ